MHLKKAFLNAYLSWWFPEAVDKVLNQFSQGTGSGAGAGSGNAGPGGASLVRELNARNERIGWPKKNPVEGYNSIWTSRVRYCHWLLPRKNYSENVSFIRSLAFQALKMGGSVLELTVEQQILLLVRLALLAKEAEAG